MRTGTDRPFTINERTENIGARRLAQVAVEAVYEVSLTRAASQGAPNRAVIDAAYVEPAAGSIWPRTRIWPAYVPCSEGQGAEWTRQKA